MNPSYISSGQFTLILLLSWVWVLPWKGVALWKASKNGHKKWFIAMFILNTLAILEIVYIFYFSKKSQALRLNQGSGEKIATDFQSKPSA